MRRRVRRAQRDAKQQAQRPPRSGVGDARRDGAAPDPEAAQGQLLPGLPGAAAHRREGAGRRDPGSLRPGDLHPLRGRSGQGHGHERHLQERGVAVVRRDRRARPRLPRSTAGRQLALRLARRNLHQGAPRRAHRLRRGDNRRGREHRRPPRSARHGRRRQRGRDLLDRFSALPDAPWPARGEAGRLRRPPTRA